MVDSGNLQISDFHFSREPGPGGDREEKFYFNDLQGKAS